MEINNLFNFDNVPDACKTEIFETLFENKHLKAERILSEGHITPPGQWYDQAGDEWVILLQGGATLLFEKNQQLVKLAPGDYLFIPAHTRHRVEWTLPGFNTVWLAVHL